jgi:hypothetical protein
VKRVACLVAVLLVAPAFGGEMPAPRALLGPELMLLANPAVHEDLGLTPQQIKKIEALNAGFNADTERAMAGKPPGASADVAIRELDDEVAAYNRELAAVLTAAQQQRVRQIQIQMVGYVAMLEPPIQKQLGLSAEETKKLDEVAQANVAEVRALREKLALGELPADEFRTRVVALGRELDRSLGEAVTPATREKLVALGGPPFAGFKR